MKLARVTAYHPETNKADLLFLATGQRVPGVRVMSPQASSSSGRVGQAIPDGQTGADPFAVPRVGERALIACVAYYDGVPVVQGFLPKEDSELLFADHDRVMERTPSDFYQTTDGKGNTEWYHPSGAYMRIGTSAAHEDLTGKDYQGKFKVRRNTNQQVYMHFAQAGGKAAITLSPDGQITLQTVKGFLLASEGLIEIKTDFGIKINSAKSIRIKAGGVDLDTPMLRVTGSVTSGIGITGSFTTTTGKVVTVDGGMITNIA